MTNLSQWFTNGEEPWENGVYQQMCGFRTEVGYQRYENGEWYAWCRTPEEAAKEKHCIGKSRDKWRGLSTNSDVKKKQGNKRVTKHIVFESNYSKTFKKPVGEYKSIKLARVRADSVPYGFIETIRFRTPEAA